jgi:hypothetical protein
MNGGSVELDGTDITASTAIFNHQTQISDTDTQVDYLTPGNTLACASGV